MPKSNAAPGALLRAAYKDLGLAEGKLLSATDSPRGRSSQDWVDKGEWLVLAWDVGAEKVFFVENNPVIVFAQHISSDRDAQRQLFQRIWNMARPPLLFLAVPGELAVYDLSIGPARDSTEWAQTLGRRRLAVARTIGQVAKKLQAFSRERIETGRLFEEKRFGEDGRADKALIADLRTVRRVLIDKGLAPQHAHAVIGRSIFIRYLEDRHVLEPEYFRKVARGNPRWQEILDRPSQTPDADPELAKRLYLRVLDSHEFTYALFDQLAKDFNGDMFPESKDERRAVAADPDYLRRVQGFLRGDPDPKNPQLFFFAYKFDVIPIELISSIYEEFYGAKKSDEGDRSTHYTPPALVDYLLSQILTPDRLSKRPRILDPAVGSGIFLVEAFRRLVRYRVHAQGGRRLSARQLRKILRDQLAGIDIDGEAVRVAAFSLYLALLHYQEPRDILAHITQGWPLPNLKYERRTTRDTQQHFDILIEANTFDVKSAIAESDEAARHRFSAGWADIVIGNPPWGSPGRGKEERAPREALDVALHWCGKERPVGDREWSQAFIHKAVDLLRDGGHAGLLVSTGVFFKSHRKSRDFRTKWLTSVQLSRVVNFAHVRDIFFRGKNRASGAQSPFAAVVFQKGKPPNDRHVFEYWSAKKTAMVQGMQSVVLSQPDLRALSQAKLAADDRLWKVYWWGGHRDEALIRALDLETALEDSTVRGARLAHRVGHGYIGKGDKKPCKELQKYLELPSQSFCRYGPLPTNRLGDPPKVVHRKGMLQLYEGLRVLVQRGIGQKGKTKGRIVARLGTEPFCFRNSIHGVRLPDGADPEAKVLLGIFWSSLARYYFWLTAGSWLWHNEIHLEHVRRMPIRLPAEPRLRQRIVSIVDRLRKNRPAGQMLDLYDPSPNDLSQKQIASLERQLDEAVFDLYELTDSERALVRDMCGVGLDLFYRGADSEALRPIVGVQPATRTGTAADLDRPGRTVPTRALRPYLTTFLDCWNRELDQVDGEFVWRIICPAKSFPMLAVLFTTAYSNQPVPDLAASDDAQWASLLTRLGRSRLIPLGTERIYIDGLVRVVTDTEIIIIKRNERRLWTASMAYEDAEATLLQAIHLQRAKRP